MDAPQLRHVYRVMVGSHGWICPDPRCPCWLCAGTLNQCRRLAADGVRVSGVDELSRPFMEAALNEMAPKRGGNWAKKKKAGTSIIKPKGCEPR